MLRAICLMICLAAPATAQDAEPDMTIERMAQIIVALDPDVQISGTTFGLTIDDTPVLIVTDLNNDRMRAMVHIRPAAGIEPVELQRLMQANFDSALDARYAIARGQLWGVFIHPFSPLHKDQFISGLAQAVNVAQTYGSLYTGGAMQFGGGDSPGLQRQLLDELLKKGEEL